MIQIAFFTLFYLLTNANAEYSCVNVYGNVDAMRNDEASTMAFSDMIISKCFMSCDLDTSCSFFVYMNDKHGDSQCWLNNIYSRYIEHADVITCYKNNNIYHTHSEMNNTYYSYDEANITYAFRMLYHVYCFSILNAVFILLILLFLICILINPIIFTTERFIQDESKNKNINDASIVEGVVIINVPNKTY